MQKKYSFLLFCCFLIASISGRAQTAASYSFSQTTGTYSNISGATNIFTGVWDDNVSNGLSIGFNFVYCGNTYSTFNINANGWINFGASTTSSYTPISAKTYAIAAFGCDLYYNSSLSGTVTYVVTGSSPNRVCTIQWLNCCHYSTATTGPLNFQIKLYETTNVIDIMYGSWTPTTGSYSNAHVGINGAATSDYNNRTTTSNWAATTAGTANTSTCSQNTTVLPANGQIFRWTPPCSSVAAITGPSVVCPGANITLSDATSSGTWSSINSSIATVNSSGVVTGVATGNATISYTTATCGVAKVIAVSPQPVVTATATPSVVCSGGSSTLNGSATNPGASYLLSSITYSPVTFTPTGTYNSTTTPTSGSNDDGNYATTIPFSFTFYGTAYTSCFIGTNGYVCFGSGMTSTSISSIPNVSFPASISLFGRDLDMRSSGSITYGVTGTTPNRIFVISYNAVPDYSSGGPETGQILIYETSNIIEFHVATAQSTTHTLGVQSASGASSLAVTGQNLSSTPISNTAWRIGFPTPSFAWVADPTLSSTTIANPTAGPLSATKTYTAIATASNGCTGTGTITVTIAPAPTALTGTFVVCQAGTTTLSSSAGGTWASSNTGIVTVTSGSSSTGIVSGVNPGTATITYSFGSACYVTKTVTVIPTTPVTGPTAVCPGLTITLSDATTAGTWSSSDNSMATVDPVTGVVTGVAAGNPSIIYTHPNGCQRSLNITVNPLPAAITGPTEVCKGLDITLTETSTGGAWSSSSTSIATVVALTSTTSDLYGVSAGSVIVTYTLPTTCIMTKAITVNPLPAPIGVPAAGSCLTNADNPPLILTDASTLGTWTSGTPGVATINSSTGALTGLTVGTTIITYTLPTTCIMTSAVTINPIPAAITGTPVVCQNAVTYLNDADFGGTWSSGNLAMATVTPTTGIVTGTGAGNPIVTYTSFAGCKVTATLTVNPAPATIAGSSQVCEGSTVTMSDATPGGTWASTSVGNATVTSGGVVTGLSAGNASIIYTLSATGCFGIKAITVNPVPAAITPVTAATCYGTTLTLNNSSPGGNWSTTATVASVSGGGVLTPTFSTTTPQTAVVSYTYPGTGCSAVRTVTINPVPVVYNLTASKTSYCAGDMAGVTLSLNNSTSGISYELYNGSTLMGVTTGSGSSLTFTNQTAAGVYTMTARDNSVFPACASIMSGTPNVSIDQLPVQFTLKTTGSSGSYCDVPGGGVHIILDSSETTSNYTIFYNGIAQPFVPGTGVSLDFGIDTQGVYFASAINPSTGCRNDMLGLVNVVKNQLPAVHNVMVTDSGYYCAGTAGAHVFLDFGNVGIDYDLYNGGTSPVATRHGANTSVDFGLRTAGVYTVVARNAVTNCTQNMNGSVYVMVRPLPPLHNVSGTGGYCAGGTGVAVKLDGSETGILYQLMLGTVATGSTLAGTGTPLAFSGQKAGGTYTIFATEVATGCTQLMSGNAIVTVYPALRIDTVVLENNGQFCAGGTGVSVILKNSYPGLAYQVFKVGSSSPFLSGTGTGSSINFGKDTTAGAVTVLATAGPLLGGCTAYMYGTPTVVVNALPAANNVIVDNSGYYCAGGSGVHIGLSFANVGVSYQLYKGGVAIGAPVNGGNSSLDFGPFTTADVYTVTGTNTATTCKSNMTGSAVVTVNPKPVAYSITGGGSYCAGTTTGVPVGVFKTDGGISYTLLYNSIPVGSVMNGTGTSVSFGNQLGTGLYTVLGRDTVTGCTNMMTGSTVITTDALPVAYNVTGGGGYCAGGTGRAIGVDNSVTGIDYKLMSGGAIVGTVSGSTGSPIDFGKKTTAGIYTVQAKNVISGCINTMNGGVAITVNALPVPYTLTGGGGYCAGGPGKGVFISNSQPGVTYQLFNGSTPSGTAPVLGTGASLDLGLQSAGTYTAVATDVATGCTGNMSGTVTVFTTPLPNAYTVSGGGTMCSNGTGINIYLSGSQSGKMYALYNGGPVAISSMPGTGSALDFGPQSTNGAYTVVASDMTTSCNNNMNGSGNIIVNPAPTAFAITGGGNYCYGGTGIGIGLSGSEHDVNYQLYNSATAVGLPVGGTGAAVTFGLQKDAGALYTIKAMNTITSCQNNMTGATSVGIDIPGTPTVSIGGTKAGVACIGEVINYIANPVLGGTAPTYTWKVNGGIVGAGSTYTNIPATGDVVSVEMVSNANCVVTDKASASVTMSALPYVTPTAEVAVTPGNNVCHGTPVTMNATTTFEGDAPVYLWMKNGAFVGSGATYTYTPNSGNDKDVITFMLRSNYRCNTSDTVFSDPIVMTVDSAVVPVVDIKSSWGPMKDAVGVGQIDTFTAIVKSSPIYNYTYQWYIQGTPVPGANQPVYIDHATYNNDVVSCQVTKTGACGDQTSTVKTTVVMKNLGAQSLTTISDISVIPNPNKGEFTVKGTLGANNDDEVTLDVTNMLGQVVYTSKVMTRGGSINEHIKLSNTLANGMYLLNVRSGNALSVFHMVIEQ